MNWINHMMQCSDEVSTELPVDFDTSSNKLALTEY
jgi:hypothetical protein